MNIHRIYAVILPYFRARRMQKFKQALGADAETTILDVGGYPWCWRGVGVDSKVTVVNLHILPEWKEAFRDVELVYGDACDLPYPDKSFDIVFSNSVIEHLGTFENQKKMAEECRRAGKKLWVQTPARSFFFEPHLLTPFVHWFPRSIRRRLLRYGTVWGWLTKPDPAAVEAFLDEVRLLSYSEMKELFPECEIEREKLLGLTKSFIAVRKASDETVGEP